jgi:ADP-heptose:LPS heptosyltransferase
MPRPAGKGEEVVHVRPQPVDDQAHLREGDQRDPRAGQPRTQRTQAGRHLELPLTAADAAEARAPRADAGLEAPYALVHPGATSPSRLWPVERFAAVADGLAARGLRVALTGVARERELTRAVRAAMRAGAADLCGATGLGAFAALVRDAALVVAADTGTIHLAAAVGAPGVAVFLSGDPVRWAHGGPHRIARAQVECNPCPHLRCPIDHRCATRLQPAQVLAAVDAARSAQAPNRPAWASATAARTASAASS